jgi:phosphotransferase system HPr (HPr) family protein
MVIRELLLETEPGLHARAAATLVMAVGPFSSKVTVEKGELRADARSILELLLLGASTGSVIRVCATGEDEELAVAALAALVLDGFGAGRDGARRPRAAGRDTAGSSPRRRGES